MAEMTKTVSGLLLQDHFSTLTGWSGDTSYFSVISNQPSFIPFDYLPINFGPTPENFDNFGTREPTPFVEDGVWYLLYDGGTGIIGGTTWVSHLAISRDRGLSWRKINIFGPGLDNGSGGSLTYGYAMGWIAKFGSTYYLYRVLLSGTNGAPPYRGDIFTASNIEGPYTYESTLPLTPGQFTAAENLPGTIFPDNGTYHLFIQGRETTATTYSLGKMSGSDPADATTMTLDTTKIISASNYSLGQPENPRVFYHSGAGVYVLLFNAFILSPVIRAIYNGIVMSSSVTDWSNERIKTIQRECPMDGEQSVGVISNFTGPENELIVGANGGIPVYYDGTGQVSSTGTTDYAYKRMIRGAVLEPSLTTFQYTGNGASVRNLWKSLAHTDFIAEFTFEFLSTVATTNGGLWFRTDGTASNGYRVIIRNNGEKLVLDKFVAGVNTAIVVATSSLVPLLTMASRIRIIASGTSIKIYFDGELQIDTTDSSFSSGTHIGLFGYGTVNAQFRLLSVRTSNVVTLSGLQPGVNVILRADGGLPVATTIANVSGEASFTHTHYPLETFEIDGTDYTPDGGIWGGDTYEFTGFSSAIKQGNNRALMKI